MTRHAMTMKPGRWKTPLAIAATVAAAEAAVLLLRPRRDPIEPAPVRAADYFSDGELERARAFRRPQRAIALAGLALDAGAARLARVRAPGAARAAAPSRAAPGGRRRGGRRRAVGRDERRGPPAGGRLAQALARRRPRDPVVDGLGGRPGQGAGHRRGVRGRRRRRPRSRSCAATRAPGGRRARACSWASASPSRGSGPVVLDPIFNRFTPLPEGTTRSDVLELARRGGRRGRRGLRGRREPPHDGRQRLRQRARGGRSASCCSTRSCATSSATRSASSSPTSSGTCATATSARSARDARARRAGRDARDRARWPSGCCPRASRRARRRCRRSRWPRRSSASPVRAVANQLSRRDRDARRRVRAATSTDAPEPFIGFESASRCSNVVDPDPPRWAELLFGTHPPTLERIGIGDRVRGGARWHSSSWRRPVELRQVLDPLAGAPLGVVVLHRVDAARA